MSMLKVSALPSGSWEEELSLTKKMERQYLKNPSTGRRGSGPNYTGEEIGFRATCRRPRTSQTWPSGRVYPYLLAKGKVT